MTFQIENNAEAFASVAVVVAAADKIGSLEEQAFLFTQVKNLAVFSGYDEAGFAALLGGVVEKAYSTLPTTELSITEEGVAILCRAVREVLEPDLRLEAYQMAVGLIEADEATEEEKALLAALRSGLELN